MDGGSQDQQKGRRRRKTGLERIRERRAAAIERARREREREQRTAAQIEEAVAKAEEKRLLEELAPIFWEHGHGKVEETEEDRREQERLAEMIERDRKDRIREQDRELAEWEVKDGVFINLADTVIEPTPEWMDKATVTTFVPKQPKETIRTIATVRRNKTSLIMKMWSAGKLTDEQAAACIWYRKTFDMAALDGRYSSSQWSAIGVVQKSPTVVGYVGHVAMHESEAHAKDAFRKARSEMTAFYLRFFDAVVLDDVPVRRAARFAKCREARAIVRLRSTIGELIEHLNSIGVELLPKENSSDD